ncbi:MAG TPA: hypothetical protein PK208_00860 [Fibrobacteria bacterium]|nr:hypothetical protein [Fibrobacteria bacterium]
MVALFLGGCRDSGLDRGKVFLQLEDWPRSIQVYDACVQNDPENAEARLGLALSRLGLVRERSQSGVDSLEEWLRVARDFAIVERLDTTQSTRSDRADALFRASQWLNRRGKTAYAERLARLAQQAHPGHASSAQFLGNTARAQGDYVSAERWYSRAVLADSSYLPAYIGLGELALIDDDPVGAVVYLQLGARRDSTNSWLRSKIARLSDSLGLGKVR